MTGVMAEPFPLEVTGLDYFGARYYSGAQGRFTSVDPLLASGLPELPQSWNRYSYGLNNPLRFIDPTGELWQQVNGGWDWVDECPSGGTCRETVAQANGGTVTVYGANSRGDISTYQANANGVVNVADIANNYYADFDIGPQRVAENYLNPATAAALFNVADLYKQQYPNDVNLVFTGGSAETGAPGVNPSTGQPLHRSHQGGANIDMRYMGPNGQALIGSGAAGAADVTRTQTIMSLFAGQNAGLGAMLTGAPQRFGLGPIPAGLQQIHRNHMHFQRQDPRVRR